MLEYLMNQIVVKHMNNKKRTHGSAFFEWSLFFSGDM